MKRSTDAASAVSLLLGTLLASPVAAQFKPEDFPPSTALPSFAVRTGDVVSIGGPGATNFLPNTSMNVYVVPHRTWREGDPLAKHAVKRIQIKSDGQGTLPRTPLWKANQAGHFDILVDYDGNGRFSYALDALDSFLVNEDLPVGPIKR